MTTASGKYDHPSYLTRQMLSLGKSVAGASGTSCIKSWPCNVRLRNVSAVVLVAGTSATTGNKCDLFISGTGTTYNSLTGVGTQITGTTSLGSITLGTSAANTVGTSGDLDCTFNAGAIFFAKNGTDATGQFEITGEAYIDPGGSWSGGAN